MTKGDHVDMESMWNMVSSYDKENFVMSCAINGGNETKREDGLVENHTYALLSAVSIAGYRMLCARNPWGDSQGQYVIQSRPISHNPARSPRARAAPLSPPPTLRFAALHAHTRMEW